MMLSSVTNTAAKAATGMDAWMAKLSEGKQSTQQLQMGMIEGVSETLKEIQAKALEKAKEEAAKGTEETANGAEVAVKTSTDGIKDPSEVTKADLQSPIDIKL